MSIVSELQLPTLYAEFSADEFGRTDLAWILYDKDKNDVTSIAVITKDAGYASGNQTLFPIHISNLPTSYVPGYLHVYFSGDLTIRPIDMDSSLVNAIILAIRQAAYTSTPNGITFQDLIAQELGQGNNTVFQAFILNAWTLWNSLYPSYPFLVYQYTKRHGISYLMGQYWNQVDSKEKDITEALSQQFSNLNKMLPMVERDIKFFTDTMVGFIQPTIGDLVNVFPIEFIGALTSPNSILYRGYPSTLNPNPLIPQV